MTETTDNTLAKILGEFDASEISTFVDSLDQLRDPLTIRIGELVLAGRTDDAQQLADRAEDMRRAAEVLDRLRDAAEAPQ